MRFLTVLVLFFVNAMAISSAVADVLPQVRDAESLRRYSGQKVVLRGYYELPNSKESALSTAAYISLDDKTRVWLFPPGDPQSRRSPEESGDYQGKEVEVFGKVFDMGKNPALEQEQSVPPHIYPEKIQRFLQESKLYDPHSVLRTLEAMQTVSPPGLKLWRFKREWGKSSSDKKTSWPWSIAREYDFILNSRPSMAFSLSLFRNLKKPALPPPPPRKDGLHAAYGPRDNPNHVTAFLIQSLETLDAKRPLPELPESFVPPVHALAATCFGANLKEQEEIRRVIETTWKKATGKSRAAVDVSPAFHIEVEANAQGAPLLSVLLRRTDKESVELRRHYCDLEPRSAHIP